MLPDVETAPRRSTKTIMSRFAINIHFREAIKHAEPRLGRRTQAQRRWHGSLNPDSLSERHILRPSVIPSCQARHPIPVSSRELPGSNSLDDVPSSQPTLKPHAWSLQWTTRTAGDEVQQPLVVGHLYDLAFVSNSNLDSIFKRCIIPR